MKRLPKIKLRNTMIAKMRGIFQNKKYPYPFHEDILKELFEDFAREKVFKILDAGSGRTSLNFLTTNFPTSKITALIYPGDDRKKKGISKSVQAGNYVLKEIDIQSVNSKEGFDIVLAHLLLGEATKFAGNTFEGVLKALLKIKTKYLIIIDIANDPDVNFDLVFDELSKIGDIKKKVKVAKYIGYLVEFIE